MTRKQRMFAAMRHEPVDRVPFSTYNLHICSPSHTQDPSYAGLLELVEAKAGMLCKIGMSGKSRAADQDEAGRSEVTTEETESHTTVTRILHTPKGDLCSVTVKPKDQPSMVTEHFIKTDEDIERYMSLPLEPKEYDVSAPRDVDRKLDGRGVAYVGYADPMHTSARLFDFNDFAVRCITDIKPVLKLIDFHFELIKADLRSMLKAAEGNEFLFYTGGPEICTPPMMAPAIFARLVTPYQKALIDMIHEAGQLASIHCHGRVRCVIDEVIKTGTDVLEPIEPPDQGDMTLAELLDKAEGRLCLVGHIQDQELHYVPEGTMARHVEEIARLVNWRTGYIMTPTCTPFQHPATDTFIRNYTEWLEAADRLLS